MDSKIRKFPKPDDHERYEELCALATSGSLTGLEWRELSHHARQCAACASLLPRYRAVARAGIPLVLADEDARTAAPPVWSLQAAKQELFHRIAAGETAAAADAPPAAILAARPRPRWRAFVPEPHFALRYAALAIVLVALASSTYYVGRERGQERVASAPPHGAVLQAELDRLARERGDLDRIVSDKSGEIERLTLELRRLNAAAVQLQALRQQLQQRADAQAAVITDLSRQKAVLGADRIALQRQLEEAESVLQPVRRKLETLQQERNQGLVRIAGLEGRIEDLSARVKENDETLRQQRQFLASDRDIRELMGARDLYIADVFDINRAGKTQKSFGRVFYTSGKSLIFYAFDLDKTPGVRDASFQAWGRRGPSDKRPLNLGIFYLDNEANKRWVLRFEDSKVLSQIDAVFVTVEPNGGRPKPGGRQLLFASLRTPPNHP